MPPLPTEERSTWLTGERVERVERVERKDTGELGTVVKINGNIKVKWTEAGPAISGMANRATFGGPTA